MKFLRRYGLILLVALLAFGLRMYRLDFFSLRGDESFTVLFVQKPLAQMWHETLTVEPNPPLLYFLLRGWIQVAGAGEFATRFFSAWFGVLCVPLVYRVARLIFGWESRRQAGPEGGGIRGLNAKTLAVVAAFLIAMNPYQIWHSQDVRNYTMWPMFSLTALLFFWNWYGGARAERTGSGGTSSGAWWLAGFAAAELAALYTHYYEAFILLALNVFVFVALGRDFKRWLSWLGTQAVLAILYLPYPLIWSNRVSAYGEGSGRQGVALWDVARETFGAFVVGDTLDANLRAWLWIPFALAAGAGLISIWTRDWKRGLFFVLYAGVPTLAVFGLNTFRPLYLERYLNGIAPVYYMLVAVGLVGVWQVFRSSRLAFGAARAVSLGAVMVVALLVLANYWTNPAYAKAPDWRGLAAVIDANAQRGDLIVQNFPETSLVYYDRSKLPLVVYPKTYLPDAETESALHAMNANYTRAWFIPAAPDYWDPDEFVEGWLNHQDDLLNEWRTGDFRLRLYATPSQYLDAMHKLKFAYRKLIALRGYRAAKEGDGLKVVLYWRALAETEKNLAVRVQAMDASGNVLGEEMSVPVGGEYPTTRWRKDELVVDQHIVPNAVGATTFRVLVCDGDACSGMNETPPILNGN